MVGTDELNQAPAPATPEQLDYSARFFLSPWRIGLFALVFGPVYTLWWMWRLYHHVAQERLPRQHSFWTILVPLYGLKTLSDQFRSVHEEASRVLGRDAFVLPVAYLMWLGGLLFDCLTTNSKGLGLSGSLLLSSALYGVVMFWVQGAANQYLGTRLQGRAHHGVSLGEVAAVILGLLLFLFFLALSFIAG